jgi:hypothetical protein
MLKTGVVVRSQFRAGKDRPIAFTLLAELKDSFAPEDEALLEAIYQQLVVAGHVYKTTRAARFPDLDGRLVEDVVQRFQGQAPVRVHDLGASSGVTSLELLRAFEGHVAVALHASDLYDHIDLVRVAGSTWTVVLDNTGRALQYVGRRFVLDALRGESKRRPVNVLLERRLRRALLPRALELEEAATFAGDDDTFEDQRGSVRRLLLVHPHVARALRERDDFTFGQHDVFEATRQRYQVVRALNILNPGYFPPARIEAALRAIAAGMEEGGLLLVGRTIDEQDRRTRATAFVKGKRRFEPVWDHHDGAENRELIAGAEL